MLTTKKCHKKLKKSKKGERGHQKIKKSKILNLDFLLREGGSPDVHVFLKVYMKTLNAFVEQNKLEINFSPIHDLFLTCSQLVLMCAWLVHDFTTFSWLVLVLIQSCSWHLDLFMTCSWHVYDLLTSCSWIVDYLFITWSRLVQYSFKTCSWIVYFLSMTSSPL